VNLCFGDYCGKPVKFVEAYAFQHRIEEETESSDTVEATHSEPPLLPLENVVQVERVNTVRKALKMLTSMEERILRLHFGIEGDEHTLDEIGEKYGVTGDAIKRVQARALMKMRHPNHVAAFLSVYTDEWTNREEVQLNEAKSRETSHG
jgi:DNA-directed RNA polymerase sigma subunit (sigma70/sigma32)